MPTWGINKYGGTNLHVNMIDDHVRAGSQVFTWNSKAKTLHTEASSLAFPPGFCPRTIAIISHRTGREVLFNRVGCKAKDGEVKYWTFKPRGDVPCKLVIFND